MMYGDVVFDLGKEPFDEVLEALKRRRKVTRGIDLSADDLKALVREYKAIVQARCGVPFPDDPSRAALGRHRSRVQELAHPARHRLPPRARHPRRPGDRREHRRDGVRQPGRGLRHRRGVHPRLPHRRARAERRLPHERSGRGRRVGRPHPRLDREDEARQVRQGVPRPRAMAEKLERHFKDVQDIEFTFEHGRLYMLQTRRAQRTGLAAVRVAVEMVAEGLHHGGRGGPARAAPGPRPGLPPDGRSAGQRDGRRQGAAGVTRSGDRRSRLRCRSGRSAGEEGPQGDSGAAGNLARRISTASSPRRPW